jgi:hypothetical protein
MTSPANAVLPTTGSLVIAERPGAPIACDMRSASDTPDERIAEYGRLFAHALIERERTADAVELRFAAKPGVAQWIEDLVRREAACCPFFSYAVRVEGDRIIWRTSSAAGPAAQAMIDELHALPERFADGFEGLLGRLAGRGAAVTTTTPGVFALQDSGREGGLLSKVKKACGC